MKMKNMMPNKRPPNENMSSDSGLSDVVMFRISVVASMMQI